MAMQKKEKILGGAPGAAGAAGGGALGPRAAPVILGLFLLPGGRPGRRLTEVTDDDPAAAGVFCSCFHKGGPDLAAPPESQGSNENHLCQPCGKVRWLETIDEKRRWCGGGGIWLGFFTLAKDALFISTYYRAPVISKAHKRILQRS
jgi:hypothetical protein